MLKSKTLNVKTRSGKILKIVREHYLRDDIENGLDTFHSPSLSQNPTLKNLLLKEEHYIVVDTNVVLRQMDVLEHSCISNVIIPQTVLHEVRHRSSPVYKKLKTAIANPDKHFFVFINEHSIDTWSERGKKESSNDYNDRLIRLVVAYYDEIVKQRGQRAVLLSNDRGNRDLAINSGLLGFTIEQYIQKMIGFPEVIDKLAKSDDAVEIDRSIAYAQHLPLSKLQIGIKNGSYYQGKMNISRDNYLEGKIIPQGHDDFEILIQGRLNLNRAVHEDIVAIKLLPENEWSKPSDVILDVDHQPSTNSADGNTSSESPSKKIKLTSKPTGVVVGIIKRNWRPYCGILEPSTSKAMTRHLFTPAERRIPRIRIETRQAEKLKGQRIVVAIDSWGIHSKYPQGHFVQALGDVGDKNTENKVLLLEHDVPHEPFSNAVLKCLPNSDWRIPQDEFKVRTDLRHLPICSVDPPGCTDIDDCLHFVPVEGKLGVAEVGVHIADVSYFIRPNTSIDEEARNRGTTVYLCDKRIDMVPELLSSNLCSLRSDGDRLAFSCIWEINTKTAEIISTKFCKSVIRSKQSLTYAEAQLRIDDASVDDDVISGLRGLNKLAKIFKSGRINKGALSLASPEVRFHVDSETHDPIDLQTKELRDTNSMVEEFMLLANCSVAKYIEQEFPDCAVLRKHPAPPQSNYDVLVNAAKSRNVVINTSTSRDLAVSLDDANLPGHPYLQTLLRILATRCMLQAVYFCSGLETDYLHYGLAAPIYTHFTSPIRRYSDILVHRLLAASIGADTTTPSLLDKHEIQKICHNINFRHRMAQYAQRASVALHTQLFFREKVVNEDGFIIFVRKNAVQVLIPKYGLEGTVFMDRTTDDVAISPEYVEDQCKLIVKDTPLQVFDKVTVEISHDASNVQHQRIIMKLISPVIPEVSVKRM